MKGYITICAVIALSLLFSLGTTAQHHSEESHSKKGSHEYHTHQHHISLFNGVTTSFSHEESAYAIGLDYKYRLSRKFGILGLAEYISFEHEEIIAGIGAVYDAYKGLHFVAAPIILFAEPEPEHAHAQSSESHSSGKETSFAFRLGTSYDFLIGNFSISPVVNWDIGKVNDLTYGVSLGYGF